MRKAGQFVDRRGRWVQAARAGTYTWEVRTHQQLDRRSLALHRLVSEKLRLQPELFARVRATNARWLAAVDRSSLPYVTQWEEILSGGLENALAVACEESERATALRQCSPFCGVLTTEERSAFFRDWKRRINGTDHEAA